MSNQTKIKLRDKKQNKLKTCLERVVISHDGFFNDERGKDGIKSTYEREIDGKTLRFKYVWHITPSDHRTLKNTRSRMHENLMKLQIEERLPSLKLREGASYEDAIMNFRKRTKQGRAFIALEKAFNELENSQ